MSTAGLGIKPPITYGRWPEVAVGRDIQDMVILEKTARARGDSSGSNGVASPA